MIPQFLLRQWENELGEISVLLGISKNVNINLYLICKYLWLQVNRIQYKINKIADFSKQKADRESDFIRYEPINFQCCIVMVLVVWSHHRIVNDFKSIFSLSMENEVLPSHQ
jgi:hypothetical protein